MTGGVVGGALLPTPVVLDHVEIDFQLGIGEIVQLALILNVAINQIPIVFHREFGVVIHVQLQVHMGLLDALDFWPIVELLQVGVLQDLLDRDPLVGVELQCLRDQVQELLVVRTENFGLVDPPSGLQHI